MAQVKQSCWGCGCEQAQDWLCSCGLLSQQLPFLPSLLAKLLAWPPCTHPAQANHMLVSCCMQLQSQEAAIQTALSEAYGRKLTNWLPLPKSSQADYQDTKQCLEIERNTLWSQWTAGRAEKL